MLKRNNHQSNRVGACVLRRLLVDLKDELGATFIGVIDESGLPIVNESENQNPESVSAIASKLLVILNEFSSDYLTDGITSFHIMGDEGLAHLSVLENKGMLFIITSKVHDLGLINHKVNAIRSRIMALISE